MAKVEIDVSQDGSRLITGDKQTLYRFVPQRYDPNHEDTTPYFIPWMEGFPDFLKDWIEDWEPFTGNAEIPVDWPKKYGLDAHDFGWLIRKGGPKKGKKQIMFRTWYLYTYKGDGPNQIRGEVNGIWQKVSPDLIKLTHYSSKKSTTAEDYTGGP